MYGEEKSNIMEQDVDCKIFEKYLIDQIWFLNCRHDCNHCEGQRY